MATTPAGNPYIESSDLVANYPATSLALANRLDKYAVNPFADAAARDAAIPTPVQGQLAQTLDDNKVWRYDGTAWAPFSGAVGAASYTNTPTGSYTDAGIDYSYITFTGTGNFEIDVAGFVSMLVVAGGGSGGKSMGGGAGAGGYVDASDVYFAVGTYTVVVGAGGPTQGGSQALNGNPSSVGLIVTLGGGGGGNSNGLGASGGSGGGSGGGSYLPQGNDGGLNRAGGSNTARNGGGGSPTEVGYSGTVSGNGANGISSSITGSAVILAAGGGAGSYNGTAGVGGSSIGGSGTTNNNAASAGQVNTGSGGGGGGYPGSGAGGDGGAGGSGIVTIRTVV